MFAISDPISPHSDSLTQSTNPVDTTHLRVHPDGVGAPADRAQIQPTILSCVLSLISCRFLTIYDLMMPNVHMCSINDAL